MPFKSAQLFLGSELVVHVREFRPFMANFSSLRGDRRQHMRAPWDGRVRKDARVQLCPWEHGPDVSKHSKVSRF